MKTKNLRFLILSLLTLIATYEWKNTRALCASAYPPEECSEIAPLIRNLRSPNETKRTSANRSILSFSSRSVENRQCVVSVMLRIFLAAPADPEGGLMLALKSPGRYAQWREAADILGTMQATEAMDSLIDNLDFNDGKTSFGIGHYPAVKAIVKFGPQAIPKLEEALSQRPPHIRTMAVLALHAIGGEKAKSILESTLKSEKDEGVATRTRNVLIGWTNSGKLQP